MPPLTMPKKVSIEGKNVGMITSAVFSPDYGGNIGFAMIKIASS